MSRTTLPVAHLYAILDREFRQLKPAACTECSVPLPYWRRPPDDVSANWFIGTPLECRHGCHLLVAELLARLWTRYDIDRTPDALGVDHPTGAVDEVVLESLFHKR